MTILASASGGASAAVTLATEVVLAFAAIASALTTIVIARSKSRKAAQDAVRAEALTSVNLTQTGWTTLNEALQKEITRLQTRADYLQERADTLENEMDTLKRLISSSPRRP